MNILANFSLLAIIITFLGFFMLAAFGRFLGVQGAKIIAVFCLISSFLLFLITYCFNYNFYSMQIFLTFWMFSGIDWCFIFDGLTLELCLLVTFITSLIVIYTFEYMSHDPHLIRFVSYLCLFSFFMLVLVTSNNFLQLFVGWEGVGLVSFLLINFWYTRLEANRAALKAMLFNKIGDLALLIAISILFFKYNMIDMWFSDLVSLSNLTTTTTNIFGIAFKDLDILVFFFFLAAICKSAQIGMHAWLSDAMEGPTPVSALLHSATMVIAGIFLLLKISMVLCLTNVLFLVIFFGSFTSFIAALFGCFYYDIKKIIAFSTCSQLGLLMTSIGFLNFNICIFHLLTHAFFKALLFLSAGSVIHALNNEQDIRKMGGLHNFLPFTSLAFLIGGLGLIGFPFLSGFYSKELLLFTFQGTNVVLFYNLMIFMFLFLTSLFTVIYSFKISYYCFFVSFYSSLKKNFEAHEPENFMLISMCLMSILTIFFGFIFEDLILGFGNITFNNILYYDGSFIYRILTSELLSVFYKLFLIIVFIFLLLRKPIKMKNWIFYVKETYIIKIFWVFSNKFGFISVYRLLSENFLVKTYSLLFVLLDRGVFEYVGPTGFLLLLRNINTKWSFNVTTLFSIAFIMGLLLIFMVSFMFKNMLILNFILILSLIKYVSEKLKCQ